LCGLACENIIIADVIPRSAKDRREMEGSNICEGIQPHSIHRFDLISNQTILMISEPRIE
jgi:hypothetical protein